MRLLPRASLRDVLRGRARLVGTRLNPTSARGFVSPIEARVNLGLDYGDLANEEETLLRDATLPDQLATVGRALAANLLAGSTNTGPLELFGIRPAKLSVAQALDRIFRIAPDVQHIYFAHPHSLNISLVDDAHHRRLSCASAILADGIGIRLAARLIGGALPSNVNGTDLFPALCERAADEGRPLVLIGGAKDVASTCAERMAEAYPGLAIALCSHGYLDHDASLRVAAQVRTLRNPLVLVGMGSPRQERWASRYLSNAPGATVLTVGGLFDFYSERLPRAPLAMRELGLEWLFRWWQEPKRLARRYFMGNPLFLSMALAQALGLPPRAIARRIRAHRLLGLAG